jgi:hypothetical protein
MGQRAGATIEIMYQLCMFVRLCLARLYGGNQSNCGWNGTERGSVGRGEDRIEGQ